MGRIISPMAASLLEDNDPGRVAAYALVYQALSERSWPVPAQPYDQISHSELEFHLQTIAGLLLKNEILAHPEYYGGHSNWEIATLFLQIFPWEPDGFPRCCVAWGGFPCSPNWITAQDVESALSE